MDYERILTLESDSEGPEKLEALYRGERGVFSEQLPVALAERPSSVLLRAWTARLAPAKVDGHARLELWGMILLALLAGLFIKMPEIFSLNEETFYSRNIALGPLGALCLYLLHSEGWPRRATVVVCSLLALTALYLNFLPEIDSDAAFLALLHAPLFLWCVAAMAYAGEPRPSVESRRGWIRFFGELIVFSGLLFLGGTILAVLTVGLFDLLGAPLDWVWEWMVPMGAAAIPVVAAWAEKRGSAGARIMPVLARIFAPLFLFVLSVYMLGLAVDVGGLFESRETLFIYNVLLLSVLGLCVFSLSGQRSNQDISPQATDNRWLHWLLAVLASLTILFDVIGLAAIVSRIMDLGLTPNRLVVLGANLAVLGNLLLLMRGFVRILRHKAQPAELEHVTARYLPVYAAWTLVVCLGFPLLF